MTPIAGLTNTLGTKIAKAIPDIWVTGIAADFTPLLSMMTYRDNFFKFDSYAVGTEDANNHRGRSDSLNNSRTLKGRIQSFHPSSVIFQWLEPILMKMISCLEKLITVR